MHGSGVGPNARALRINPNPIGTPDELKAQGISLKHVGSCAPASPGVRGCPYYDECLFRLRANGGFRDHGPKYVGYFHQTHDGNRVQNDMVCHAFMKIMASRMRDGLRDRSLGLNGEIIRIIAQEGEMIRPHVVTDANEGQDGLKPKYVRKHEPRPVHRFPRPGEENEVTYDAQLAEEERRRQEAEDNALPLRIEDMEATAPALLDDEPYVDPGPAAAVAAPVAPKPRRAGPR